MINSNLRLRVSGEVIECRRRRDGSILNVMVCLNSGYKCDSVLGFRHASLKAGDRVKCILGFRITSDRYVLESCRKINGVTK